MAGLKDGDDFKDGEAFKSPTLLKLLCAVVGFGGLLLFFYPLIRSLTRLRPVPLD